MPKRKFSVKMEWTNDYSERLSGIIRRGTDRKNSTLIQAGFLSSFPGAPQSYLH